MKNKLEKIILCLSLVAVIFLLYWPITKTFYQQDEWLGYGLYLVKGFDLVFVNTKDVFSLVLGEGRILYAVLLYFFYNIAPLNVFPIAFFALLVHGFNAVVVFLLAKRVVKSSILAFLGTTFFAVNSVSQSAITWPAASLNTLPSTALILLSVLLYFKYLDSFKKKWIILSFVGIYLSLFFKESGIFLFVLFPLFSFFYKKDSILQFLKRYWFFFLSIFIIVFYRIYSYKQTTDQVALFLTGSTKYFFDSLVVRSILYPLTSFSLSLVPPESSLNFARYITNVYYPFFPPEQFILIAQTAVLDLVAVVLSLGIGVFLITLLKSENKKIFREIEFWIAFLVLSFLPFIVISKSYSYLESRYYYAASAAWGVILAWILSIVFKKIKVKAVRMGVVLIYLIFIFVHVVNIHTQITEMVNVSQTRIKLVLELKRLEPNLKNDKNIFYITGDTDYYLPGNRVPFQNGFGYTLMTLYYSSDKIPSKLLENHFLFDIGSQGYQEVGSKGFGYFYDKVKLKEVLKQYKLTESNVIEFNYSSKDDKFTKLN